MRKFTRDTTLAEILKEPEAEKILSKYNVPCLGCAFAHIEMETLKIGDVCEMYGIDGKKLIEELNNLD